MKKKKKNIMYVLVILLAISLLVILGSIRFLSNNSDSFFARLKIRNDKIQKLYNYNLFDASTYTNNIVKKYKWDIWQITYASKGWL